MYNNFSPVMVTGGYRANMPGTLVKSHPKSVFKCVRVDLPTNNKEISIDLDVIFNDQSQVVLQVMNSNRKGWLICEIISKDDHDRLLDNIAEGEY